MKVFCRYFLNQGGPFSRTLERNTDVPHDCFYHYVVLTLEFLSATNVTTTSPLLGAGVHASVPSTGEVRRLII